MRAIIKPGVLREGEECVLRTNRMNRDATVARIRLIDVQLNLPHTRVHIRIHTEPIVSSSGPHRSRVNHIT